MEEAPYKSATEEAGWVSHLAMKEHSCHVYNNSNAPEANNWTNNIHWSCQWLRTRVPIALMMHTY